MAYEITRRCNGCGKCEFICSMDAIRRSGDNYETPNNIFGYGIPDFAKAYTILKEKR